VWDSHASASALQRGANAIGCHATQFVSNFNIALCGRRIAMTSKSLGHDAATIDCDMPNERGSQIVSAPGPPMLLAHQHLRPPGTPRSDHFKCRRVVLGLCVLVTLLPGNEAP